MNKKYLALTLRSVITSIVVLFSACKKINSATELGSGLIPAVDNVTTFDTTLEVQAFNDTFGISNDSLRFSPSYPSLSINDNEAFLGLINNDPFFGKTDARIFLELKPSSYKFSFARTDSLILDSIVLVLDYRGTYGDTTIPQIVNVYELDQSNDFRADSIYLIRQNNFTYSNLLGSKTVFPYSLDDSVLAFADTTKNQLRIRLNSSFGDRLLHYDSTSSPLNGAYSSDSAFRTFFKGFALQSMSSGNAIMGFSPNGTNTKLAIYYNYNNISKGKRDTTVSYFNFTNFSSSANYVKRDYSGTPVAAAAKGTTPASFVYIQNSPGTFATLKIPALASLDNRVVHRAELIAEEVLDPNPSNAIFTAPTYLHLDAFDPSISKYRTIPYDFFYDPSSGSTNLGAFGASPVNAVDGSGKTIKVWHFTITRYVQHILTHTQPLYDLRLYAPFIATNQYGLTTETTGTINFPVNPRIARGRVRLAGGTPGPQRMRLRIVYSKL